MKRLTGAADENRFCDMARIEITGGGRPGRMDVLVHAAPFTSGVIIPPGAVAEILEAALAIVRGQ